MVSEMPYSLIPLIGSLILGCIYVMNTDASSRSKLIISIIVAMSVVIWRWYPQLLLLATLLQTGVSVYVLVYLKVKKLDV